jgi:hypothetical protein
LLMGRLKPSSSAWKYFPTTESEDPVEPTGTPFPGELRKGSITGRALCRPLALRRCKPEMCKSRNWEKVEYFRVRAVLMPSELYNWLLFTVLPTKNRRERISQFAISREGFVGPLVIPQAFHRRQEGPKSSHLRYLLDHDYSKSCNGSN